MAAAMIIGHTFARRTTHTLANTHVCMNKVTNIELKDGEEEAEAEENATKS